ncbi:SMI1/KNR4 family protein [Burkholderia perseverans]|uniref:SMI1/KNR4 family protein n=1 Tax=Burkholderia perseverans TaxID=2615214 RepID=UPI001FEE4B4A|nr:SMI1/KNR4 family protein [Burkholderia perseverans]
MQKLEQLVERTGAQTRPADAAAIEQAERQLGFALSDEYRAYLSTFGVIVHEASEVYGLGVPDDYYLNVVNAWRDLSRDPAYPARAVPLLEIGDGHYWLYDNAAQAVLHWATPNGGVVETLAGHLEPFLVEQVFGDEAA